MDNTDALLNLGYDQYKQISLFKINLELIKN